ncbi:hypothetical protein HOY80DRAFT_1039560, partial [Tuber brumale]
MEPINTADGLTLYVHKGIIDSKTGLHPDIPWDSFAASTVERFLEHCYQGDYRVPKPVKLPLGAPTSQIVDDEGYTYGVFHTSAGHLPCSRFVKGRVVPQEVQHFCRICVTIQADGGKDHSGSLGHPHVLDYFEVFLAHAELYILSQTQGRSSLTALCLDRLREALDKAAKAPLRPRFANNLSDLLFHVYNVYGYSNIKLIDGDQAHGLQNLVLSYAAMHIKEIKEECSLLMRYGGRVAEGLMEKMKKWKVDGREREKNPAARASRRASKRARKEANKMEMEKIEMGKEELEKEEREMEEKEMEKKAVALANKRARKRARKEAIKMEMEKIEMEKKERDMEKMVREEREREMEMEKAVA